MATRENPDGYRVERIFLPQKGAAMTFFLEARAKRPGVAKTARRGGPPKRFLTRGGSGCPPFSSGHPL